LATRVQEAIAGGTTTTAGSKEKAPTPCTLSATSVPVRAPTEADEGWLGAAVSERAREKGPATSARGDEPP